MNKRITCIILSLVIAISILSPLGTMICEASSYAWPGRPGGNGDGSEEWLQGEYGEMDGPYEPFCTQKGPISDLTGNSNLTEIAQTLIGVGIVKIHPEFGTVVTVTGLLAALKSNQYKGAYYVMDTYVSGRSMKIVTNTYRNDNYTGWVDTYTTYVEW